MPTGPTGERDRRRRETSGTRRPRGSARSQRPNGNTRGKRVSGPGTGRDKTGSRAGTGGAFKLSSTRRAAVLAILVCAMALSLSVPLRTYLSQREELATLERQREELSREVDRLAERKQELSDPQHLEAEARKRLGYVRPGETPYIVRVPEKAEDEQHKQNKEPHEKPWYEQLWKTLTG